MIINLVIAYVFYLLPLLFSNTVWLALGPILMGFFQHIVEQGMAGPADWILGSAYFAAAVYLLIIKGNMWLKNPRSPFDFFG